MHGDSKDAANLSWFREAAPYLRALQGATLVVAWSGANGTVQERAVLADCMRLALLGARVVLVHGIRDALDQAFRDRGVESTVHRGVRVTAASHLPLVREVAGSERLRVEAQLSAGALAVGFDGKRVPVVTCNAVTARPYGVHGGVDHEFSGAVRRVDAASLRAQLDSGAMVLQSPMAWAPSGDLYNVRHEEVATEIATALRADKLIFLAPHSVVEPVIAAGNRELSPAEADARCRVLNADVNVLPLQCAADACRRGVRRAYLLNAERDGALVNELLTRDGAGTMVAADTYEGLRPATPEDVPGLVQLTSPQVADGSLVARAQEQFEHDIEHFAVIERDGTLVACAAAVPHAGGVSEFCCLATHADYRNAGRAAKLLSHVEAVARQQGQLRLVVLTTQTVDWFLERGFTLAKADDLPSAMQARYSPERNSKVLVKPL